jgi:hypothetical protein
MIIHTRRKSVFLNLIEIPIMKVFSLILITFVLIGCSSPSPETGKGNTQPVLSTEKENDLPTEKQSKEQYSAGNTDSKDENEIKKLIHFTDDIKEYIEWSDAEGQHIVITNESGVYHNNEREDGALFDQNAEVKAYHFIKEPGKESFEQSWKIYDYSKECEVDANAKFKKNVLQKTDLNKNGVAEIWVMYFTYCKGDVSPSNLKLIMYEGNQKYKMSGETLVNIGENATLGGEISSVGNFETQPVFLKFAKTLWKKNNKETSGE